MSSGQVVEYVRYRISDDRRAGFEQAYVAAGAVLAQSPQCIDYDLTCCVDEPACYILRITWTSADGHLSGFRAGELFPAFFAAIKPYVSGIEEMRHYLPTAVRGHGGSAPADAEQVAHRLRLAMLIGDAGAIAATLAEDARFYSPASVEPTRGRAAVADVLTAAKQVYGEMAFTDPLAAGSTAALFFDAEVDGHQLEGCYRVHVSPQSTIARLDALMRPEEATRALITAMMKRSNTAPDT